VDTVIVLLSRNLTWLGLQSWLRSGIRKNLVQKFRALSFVRVLGLLDSDMLLDACGLSGLPTIDISRLHGLPAQVAVMGSIKVRVRSVVLTSATRSVPPNSRHNFGLLDSWEGPLREISQGVAHVALQLASGLAVEFGAQHTLTLDTLERVKTSGIPSSFDAYKAMCRATHSRIASERAHFYERAITLNPGYADAYSGLGTHLARNGQLEAAVKCFLKQKEIAPNDHDAYSSLGMAYGEMGLFNEALEFLHRATELYPQGDPAVFSNLGVLYDRMTKCHEAMDAYHAALAINPLDADVNFNLGKLHLTCRDLGGPPEARKWLQKAAGLYGTMYQEKRTRVLQLLHSLPS
jgi:Flp pilus assembly protein TadD